VEAGSEVYSVGSAGGLWTGGEGEGGRGRELVEENDCSFSGVLGESSEDRVGGALGEVAALLLSRREAV